MSRARTLSGLGFRNAFRGAGRLAVLTLLLASALVARSVSSLVVDGLCRQAVATVTDRALPDHSNTMVFCSEPLGLAWSTEKPLRDALRQRPSAIFTFEGYIPVHYEPYLGPGGKLYLVRLAPGVDSQTGASIETTRPELWVKDLRGTYASRPGEVAIPTTLAERVGLEPGAQLTLVPEGGGPPVTFRVTGIYTPLGHGLFYEFLLSVRDTTVPPAVNLLVLNVNQQLGWALPFQAAEATGATATVMTIDDPDASMLALARAVYAPRSTATGIGFALVGVAVLVVLLVAMTERRREAAGYKLIGLAGPSILRVLLIELSVSLGLAVASAAPVYWLLVARRLVDVQAAGVSVIWSTFAGSLLWTAVITLLGAAYPFSLTMVGTPSALLSGQRIYLFRRKRVLRGWVELDSEQ